MHKQSDFDPYNLDYITRQVEAIKAEQNIPSDKEVEVEVEAEIVRTRKIEDILEEQLIILRNMQHTLERIEAETTRKGWKKLF